MEHDTIIELIKRHVTFAAYMLPGEGTLQLLVDIPGRDTRSTRRFVISRWNEPSSERIIIRDTIDETKLKELLASMAVPQIDETDIPTESTNQYDYSAQVEAIVKRLWRDGGKTVLSRIICGETPTNTDWWPIAERYFCAFPDTFRFIYYTPSTGGWLGATPELLIEANLSTGRGRTMALAGTRPSGLDTAWDTKNVREQNFVLEYIVNTLIAQNIPYPVISCRTLKYGPVEHRCHDIEFDLGNNRVYPLLDSLSPTPALAGTPKQKAIAEISRLEHHDRECYGGYVAVEDGNDIKAYVNLRSMKFSGHRYCIFAGGGITADSNASDEWTETERKVSVLKQCIKG